MNKYKILSLTIQKTSAFSVSKNSKNKFITKSKVTTKNLSNKTYEESYCLAFGFLNNIFRGEGVGALLFIHEFIISIIYNMSDSTTILIKKCSIYTQLDQIIKPLFTQRDEL